MAALVKDGLAVPKPNYCEAANRETAVIVAFKADESSIAQRIGAEATSPR